jgi:hypothetical protein
VLCLYDNAGEHFQPGQDTTGSPVTRHMAQARPLLFLIDPLQDPRFQQLSRQRQARAEIRFLRRAGRQESVLLEAAARVRRFLGLPHSAKHDRPLVVVLTKWDAWAGLLGDGDPHEPWEARGRTAGLDLGRVQRRSQDVRRLLLDLCPELVAAAEGFCREVVYVPVSALGRSPEPGPGVLPSVRPRDIRPLGVMVPLLYGLGGGVPGLSPRPKQSAPAEASAIRPAKLSGPQRGR